jgi:hypothetical protein
LKILLDEDVPRKLARLLVSDVVETVVSMGWGGVKNGALLALVERAGFEVFVTGDKNMQAQQRLGGRGFGVVILSAISWPVILAHVEAVIAAIGKARAGSVQMVDCGKFIPRQGNWPSKRV